MNYRKIKGTQDILPPMTERWQEVERCIHNTARLYGLREVRTPMFEMTELFVRSLGETTDIVGKEMYTFADRGERSLTLRPEGTAGVARAYFENSLYHGAPRQKLYYIGSMFRQENVQKGRLREFHQFGAEVIGAMSPLIDAELVAFFLQIMEAVGLERDAFTVEVGTVGCRQCRPGYRRKLVEYLRVKADGLCRECRQRLETNPLRVLDCKVESCRSLTADAPTMAEDLCEECTDHFGRFRDYLSAWEIPYTINKRLVRGLDYYTKSVFEVTSTRLGAQSALMGGGRYDDLLEEVGGRSIPAVGFSCGMERLMLLLGEQLDSAGIDCFFVLFGDGALSAALPLIDRLRHAGLSCDLDTAGRAMKAQMKQADRLGARFACIIGDDEVRDGTVSLKEMAGGEQTTVPAGELVERLRGTPA